MATQRTLSAFLADRIRELRTAKGWSQDDLARVARERAGVSWNRNAVAGLEAGKRALLVDELLLLPAIFEHELSEILKSSHSLRSVNGTTLSPTAVQRILTGEFLESEKSGLITSRLRNHVLVSLGRKPLHQKEVWPNAKGIDIVRAEEAAMGIPEQQAAAKIGVHTFTLSYAAFALWRRSLSDERDERVRRSDQDRPLRGGSSAKSQRAVRGHVTRALVRELAEYIKEKTRRKR